MITEVAVADDAQLAAFDQHAARFHEHLPGDRIADAVFLGLDRAIRDIKEIILAARIQGS